MLSNDVRNHSNDPWAVIPDKTNNQTLWHITPIAGLFVHTILKILVHFTYAKAVARVRQPAHSRCYLSNMPFNNGTTIQLPRAQNIIISIFSDVEKGLP